MANACAMVARCFERQHPEDFGRPFVGVPAPREAHSSVEPGATAAEPLPASDTGRDDAVPIVTD